MRHHQTKQSSIISIDPIRAQIQPHSTIIVGLSGGPDSVCLLHILHQLQTELSLTLIAAHLDHQWRSNSAQDKAWCQQLCAQLGITFESSTASQINITSKYNGSLEERGRILRRTFFSQLTEQYNAHAIALAHHQDDQIETFFIRLLRGTSPAGLGCMKAQDGIYIRPILHLQKTDILKYLKQHNLEFVVDETNTNLNFLRNRIRHTLLSTLETIDPRWNKTIPACINQMQATDDFLQHHTMQQLTELTTMVNSQRYINIQNFLQLHPIIQHRMLLMLMIEQDQAFTPTTKLFEEIIRFLKFGTQKSHQIHPKYQIIKNKDSFYFQML